MGGSSKHFILVLKRLSTKKAPFFVHCQTEMHEPATSAHLPAKFLSVVPPNPNSRDGWLVHCISSQNIGPEPTI